MNTKQLLGAIALCGLGAIIANAESHEDVMAGHSERQRSVVADEGRETLHGAATVRETSGPCEVSRGHHTDVSVGQ